LLSAPPLAPFDRLKRWLRGVHWLSMVWGGQSWLVAGCVGISRLFAVVVVLFILRVVFTVGERVVGCRFGRLRCGVVLVVRGLVDLLVWIILGYHVLAFHQGHVFLQRYGFDAGDGQVGDGYDGPCAAVYAFARHKGHEIVVVAGVASWIKGNGAERARFSVAGRAVIHLDIGAEFELETAIVRFWLPSDYVLGNSVVLMPLLLGSML
jgi:hypothetical protein